ncbi:MAG: hypothetical protein ACI8PT_000996, partial [Gammaproteobacteria bacterium]
DHDTEACIRSSDRSDVAKAFAPANKSGGIDTRFPRTENPSSQLAAYAIKRR